MTSSRDSHTGGLGSLNLTEDQVKLLEYNFKRVSKMPDGCTLMLIAAECGLSEEDTAKWFKIRIAKWRESEGLPSESRHITD